MASFTSSTYGVRTATRRAPRRRNAATAAVMVMSAVIPPKPKEFLVDQPFRFVLRRRGAILFTGRITDPVDPGPAS